MLDSTMAASKNNENPISNSLRKWAFFQYLYPAEAMREKPNGSNGP
ncbi:MAG: hypothetical protein QW332_06930 [Thermoproteota archaeon]